MTAPLRDRGDSAFDWRPGKLWSLWDIMINYQIFGLCQLLHQLSVMEAVTERRLAIVALTAQQPGVQRELIPGTGMYVDELVTDQDCEQAKCPS
jgi:hypothetical protein